MKIKIEGAIYFDPDSAKFGKNVCAEWRFCAIVQPNFAGYVLAAPHTIEAEIPDDFDPRPGMVEALRKERQEAERAFAARVMEIDRRINSLLAIENAAEAVPA